MVFLLTGNVFCQKTARGINLRVGVMSNIFQFFPFLFQYILNLH